MTRCLAALISLPVVLVSAISAHAGTYNIVSCGPAADATNHAWALVNHDVATITAGDTCAAEGGDSGLYAEDRLGPGPVPTSNSDAYFELAAPAGAKIVGLRYDRRLYRHNDSGDWRIGLMDAAGTMLDDCPSAPDCVVGGSGRGGERLWGSLRAAVLRFGVWCRPAPPFTGCDHGATLHSAQAVIYSSTVTIDDPVAPDGVSLTGAPSGWVRQGFAATVSAGDNVSVSARTVQIDGQEVGRVDAVCDDSYVAPCPAAGSADVPVDISGVADGVHRMRAVAYDPGGLATSSAESTITVDRHAPEEPGLRAPGPRYSALGRRTLDVTVPAGQVSPVTAAITQVCQRGTDDCRPAVESEVDTSPAQVAVEIPEDGEYDVRVWLRDAAGNSDPAAYAAVPLGRDSVAPAVTLRVSRTGDIADGTVVTARYDQQDPAPSSGPGPAGFEISVDGGGFEPSDGDVVAQAGHQYRLRAFVTDQAGNRTTTPSVSFRGVDAPSPAPSGGVGAAATPTAPAPQSAIVTAPAAPARIRPALRLLHAVYDGRLTLRAVLPRDATGAVVLRVTGRHAGRRWSRSRTLTLHRGSVTWSVHLPPAAGRVRLSATYGGDARYDAGARRARIAQRP